MEVMGQASCPKVGVSLCGKVVEALDCRPRMSQLVAPLHNRDFVSLVPRPFPPPVFDHLQYANTEGEGLGDLVMCGYVRPPFTFQPALRVLPSTICLPDVTACEQISQAFPSIFAYCKRSILEVGMA